MRKIEKRESRHTLALTTAKYTALTSANASACTNFTKPDQGRDNPMFRRTYVHTFQQIYAQVMHDDG